MYYRKPKPETMKKNREEYKKIYSKEIAWCKENINLLKGNKFLVDMYSILITGSRKMVENMRNIGINVLSYFIGGDYSYDSDNESFKNMYGSDAAFINATNMMEVAKTMNKKFLSK